MEKFLTVESLVKLTEPLLSASPECVDSVPLTSRTVTYYVSAGVVDKPFRKGPSGGYHRRHAAQIVAVRTLQARGFTLSAIRTRIKDLGTAELVKLSGIDPTKFLTLPVDPAGKSDFWKESAPLKRSSLKSRTITSLTLAKGVTLNLEGFTLGDDDLSLIEGKAKELLAILPPQHKETR